MKNTLKSSGYLLLLVSFKDWLQALGYSPFSVPNLTASVHRFLYYQEQRDKTTVEQLTADDARAYIAWLGTQTGERTGRPFSGNHLNKQIQALKLFSRYLRESGKSNTGFVLERLEETRRKPTWLTKLEIQALYEATADNLLGACVIRPCWPCFMVAGYD